MNEYKSVVNYLILLNPLRLRGIVPNKFATST